MRTAEGFGLFVLNNSLDKFKLYFEELPSAQKMRKLAKKKRRD